MALFESARKRQTVNLPLRTRSNPLRLMVEDGDLPVEWPGRYERRSRILRDESMSCYGWPGAAKPQPKKKKRTANARRCTRMQKETPTSLGNLVADPAERDPKPCPPRQSEAATGRLYFIEYQPLLRHTLLKKQDSDGFLPTPSSKADDRIRAQSRVRHWEVIGKAP